MIFWVAERENQKEKKVTRRIRHLQCKPYDISCRCSDELRVVTKEAFSPYRNIMSFSKGTWESKERNSEENKRHHVTSQRMR
jgi:hypothetical protein